MRDEPTRNGDALPDAFDRALGALDGRPDTLHTKTFTKTVLPVLGIGGSTTYVVQTWRTVVDGDRSRDQIFLQAFGAEGHVRLVLPPDVADAIARQRDSLGTRRRVLAGKRNAAERKARGEEPAFMKTKRATKRARKGN